MMERGGYIDLRTKIADMTKKSRCISEVRRR